jgi:hypothetical protein
METLAPDQAPSSPQWLAAIPVPPMGTTKIGTRVDLSHI